MLSLPMPLVASLILGFLVLRAAQRRAAPWPLLVLIGSVAVQGAIIAARQHYGMTLFDAVQPVTAMAIPAIAWLAFQIVARRGQPQASDLWHLAGPAFGAFCVGFAPVALDQAVLISFLGYGGAILFTLRGGRDALERTRLDSGEAPLRIWRWIGIALILSGISDGAIFALQINGLGGPQGLLISLFWTATLLAIGALALSEELGSGADVGTTEPTGDDAPADASPSDMDTAMVAAMNALMAQKRLFLDPDLTLNQIARRLHVPAKTLSAAINRVRGENVSRMVNALRIEHACAELRAGRSVTHAMLNSGFNTKSNFNREFLRVIGMAPSDWLKQQHIGQKPAAAPR